MSCTKKSQSKTTTHKKLDSAEKFIEIFKNKIIMYLFEDVAKRNRSDLFKGSTKGENVIYSKVCDDFDSLGVGIFHESISNQFLKNDGD